MAKPSDPDTFESKCYVLMVQIAEQLEETARALRASAERLTELARECSAGNPPLHKIKRKT